MTDSTNLKEVRNLLSEKKRELMDRYSAQGVAIGKDNPTDPDYVLVVYLEKAPDSPMEPQEVEGVPIRFKVTGRFKAQNLGG
jgi:hypothetical protein